MGAGYLDSPEQRKRGVPDGYFVLCTATANSPAEVENRSRQCPRPAANKERQQYLCSLRDPPRITPFFNNTTTKRLL